MPQGTVSKNIKLLALRMVRQGDTHVKKGLELVNVRPDLYDPKRHAVFLTEKGRALVKELNSILVTGLV